MSNQKKPSYLYEVFDSASEEETQEPTSEEKEKSSYSVFICKETEHQPKCCLCGNMLKLCFDLREHVEGSDHTFSDVLAKLFSRERLQASLARKDLQGLLCTDCRELVKNLYRLQRELKAVKNEVVRIFRNSENNDFEDKSTDESDPEPVSLQKRIKLVKKPSNDSTKKETFKVFNNQKRKRDFKGTIEVKNKKDNQDATNVGSYQKRKEECKKIRKTEELSNLDILENIGLCVNEVEEEEDNSKSVKNRDTIKKGGNLDMKTYMKELDNEIFDIDIDIILDEYITGTNTDEIETKECSEHLEEVSIDKSIPDKYGIQKSNKSTDEHCTNINKHKRDTSQKGYNKKETFSNASKVAQAFFDLYVLDEYMNVDNKSDKKKTIGNKSVKHKDEKETSTDNTNITTNDESDSVDDVYNIESLVEKKGSIYLVKWENYPEDQNTWESKCSIPDCVREFYESDLSRLGKPIPPDLIKNDDYDSYDDPGDDNWKPAKNKKNKKGLTKKDTCSQSLNDIGKQKMENVQKKTKPKNKKISKEDEISMQEDKKLSAKDANSVQDDENERTIELLLARNGWKYLVKWKNLSHDENTWEHWIDIPKTILNYYQRDLSRLGSSPYIPYI